MKIVTPRRMVASWAPTRVLMPFAANRPKAAEPPALFIRLTMAPRITKNTRIPTLLSSVRTPMMPSWKIWTTVRSKLPPEYRIPPTAIPINREL